MDALDAVARDVFGFETFTGLIITVVIVLASVSLLKRAAAFVSGEDKAAATSMDLPEEYLMKDSAGARKEASVEGEDEKEFTAEEVALHSRRDDCWLILDGGVYDVSSYVEQHFGGDAILRNAGRDSSVGFHGDQHQPKTFHIVKKYRIGKLASGTTEPVAKKRE